MKKIILITLFMVSVVIFGACDGTGTTTEHSKVFSETLITYAMGDDADHVRENVTLKTTSDTVLRATLTWISSDPEIIEIGNGVGLVTRPAATTKVVLTLKVEIDGISKQKKFQLTVLEAEDEPVRDTTAPVISGAEDITLYVGDPDQDWLEGVFALDDVDGEVEVYIVENTVDLDRAGSYYITFGASDQAGNTSQETIIVTVLEVQVQPETTYTETFSNLSGSTSNYGDISFTGVNGVRWTIVGSRSDQDLDGKAVTFGGLTDNSKISAVINGGVSRVSFDAKKAFQNTNPRQLELKINGVSYGTFTIDAQSEAVSHFEVTNINVTGEFTLEIIHITGASSRAQITIDNLSWTTYQGVTVPTEKVNLDKDGEALTFITSYMEATTVDLPTVGQYGSTITWSYVNQTNANNNLVDLTTGEISMPTSGQVNVGIKATLTNGSYQLVKTFTLLIGEGNPLPISEARAQSKDAKVKVQGVITSVYQIGSDLYFFVQDNTGGILVVTSNTYRGVVAEGKEVVLIGAIDVVNSDVRLNRLTKLEVTGTKSVEAVMVNNPANLKNYQGQLIEISGLLKQTYSGSTTTFVLVNDKGNFELVIPTGLDSSVITSICALLNGKDAGILVNIEAGVVRNQTKYQLVLASPAQIVVDDEVDYQIVWNVVKSYLKLPDLSKPIATNLTLTLPVALDVLEEIEIVWSSSHPQVISNSGKVTQVDDDVIVTLSYEVLLNGQIIYEDEIVVTVLEKSDYDGYYASINGLTGQTLKDELKRIISKMTNISYSDTSFILDETDADPNRPGNVLLVYNRASVSGVWNGSTWNKEHIWPQSKLGSASKSDLFNLRPANPSINSSRGNLAYVDGSGTYGRVGSGWFPGEEDKGDIARAVFYMNTRWGLSINSNIGNLNTFLKWHAQDPVDEFERHRNEVIYSYQKNRNPYVDYPELVDKVYGSYNYISIFDTIVQTYYVNYDELKRDYTQVGEFM